MKGADIRADGTAYMAKVDYGARGKVTVLEKGVPQRYGYGHATRSSGVRVRVAAPILRGFGGISAYAEGHERVIATRDIEREWTPDDEARLHDQREGAARAEAVTERLIALGFGVGHGSDVTVTRDGGATFTAEALARLLDGQPHAEAAPG